MACIRIHRQPEEPLSPRFYTVSLPTAVLVHSTSSSDHSANAVLFWNNSQIVPLVILLLFLGGAAFVGYQIFLSVSKIEQQARDKMAKKNVVFTKDGMRVGVKHVEQEKYVDATQSWVMKAWNMSAPSATKRK
jgi:hypothetical protein